MSKEDLRNAMPPFIDETEIDSYCEITPYEKRSESDFLDFLIRPFDLFIESN